MSNQDWVALLPVYFMIFMVKNAYGRWAAEENKPG